jgi:glutaredoxin
MNSSTGAFPGARRGGRVEVEEFEPRLLLAVNPIIDFNGDGRSDIALHRPISNSGWGSVPVLYGPRDRGVWTSTNSPDFGFASQPGVVAIPGRYNDDNLTDIAFHRPGGGWTSVPVLFANRNGTWTPSNLNTPSFANQSGVVAISGDFNNDDLTDIAFHRPVTNSGWNTLPVLFANGRGGWTARNLRAPTYVHQSGVVAVPGRYDDNDRTDIAFHRPILNGGWNTMPVLFANGDGSWTERNLSDHGFANQPGVRAVPADYDDDDDDNLTDVAFHRPGGGWGSVPVLFANGDGSWRPTNVATPSFANQSGVVAVSGNFNDDDFADIAFHRPVADSGWNTVPVLFADGEGGWDARNLNAPSFANLPGVVAVSGDYDGDDDNLTDIAFHRPVANGGWNTVPVLYANGDGSWSPTNESDHGFANQVGVKAVDRVRRRVILAR